MEVKVTIDCSDRLEQLAEKALDIIGAVKVKPTETKPRKKKAEPAQKEEPKIEDPKVDEEKAMVDAYAETEKDEAPALVLEPETPDEPKEEVKKIEIPESAKEAPVMEPQDVRQAMLDTYTRLESQVSDDLKDKVHENAKEIFKVICKGFGVAKPSQLPDGASRWEFVNQLNSVHVDEEGNVTPF